MKYSDKEAQADKHNDRGVELMQRGWVDEAISEFEKAKGIDPQAMHAASNLAGALAEKKQFRRGLMTLLESIEKNPQNAEGHAALAAFLTDFSHAMALTELDEAIEIEPDLPGVHTHRAMTLRDIGKNDDAIASLETAIRIDADDIDARLELADVLAERKSWNASIAQLKEVTKRAKDEVEGHLKLGVLFAYKGFYDQAEASLASALSLDDQNVHVHLGFALLNALRENPEGVKQAIQTAQSLDKDSTEIFLNTNDVMLNTLSDDERLAFLQQPSTPA